MEGKRKKEEGQKEAGADWFARGAGVVLWLVVGVCCVAPLIWLMLEMGSWDFWRNVQWDGFRWKLLGRTLLYNGGAAVVAVLMGLPAAVVVGRGRGVVAKVLMFLLPLGLVMPSVAYTYGWSHVLWLSGITPVPASIPDILRCVWTLAAWLWALPALVIGMALRGLDSEVQQAAMLDGVLWRITLRLLIGPIVASLAMTMALAVQEFAVYERTGIVVISTEVRTVFESGIGSGDRPANVAGVVAGAGRDMDNQARRAGVALATSLPMILLAAGLTGAALVILRRSCFAESLEAGGFPQCVAAGWLPKLATALLCVLTVAIPVAAMALSISPYRWETDSAGHGIVTRAWLWAGNDVLGSLFYGVLAGGATLVLALLAAVRLRPMLLLMALAAFLIGGEILAIADIRLFNREGDFWQAIYNGPAIMVITCVGRFGWIGLVAGFATTGGAWRSLRDTAAVDGAGTWQTMRRVVWPLAWPVLLGSAVLVMILTMTEVSAAVLVSPLRPTMLVPRLMGWVHMLRYDDMLEGTLLLAGLAAALGAVAVGLIWLGRRLVLPRRADMR
jgi:ABC-type Fe3+ transport system permease subunit